MAEENNRSDAQDLPTLPQYVLNHAPLLRLHSQDQYLPSSIAAQLTHTHPAHKLDPVSVPCAPLTLNNLSQLNSLYSNSGKDIYLTGNDDITTDPKWLKGIVPDTNDGAIGEKTAIIIAVEKGNGVVDAFYLYFWAFNWGGVVLGKQLGDHVGDWEHNMIRFISGEPKYVWLSQHSNGEAYAFSALEKDATGKRPIIYAAKGSHALYATAGTHDHTIPNINLHTPLLLVDYTDSGPLYDPILSSYTYTYIPSAKTFSTTSNNPDAPTSFLDFTGHWGDMEFPEDDPRQKGKGLFGFKKYVGGPTGPADKGLDRKEVWPEGQWSKGQRIRTSLDGSSCWKDLFSGWFGVKKIVRKRRDKKMGVRRIDVSEEEVENMLVVDA